MQQGQIDALDFIAISAMAAIISSEQCFDMTTGGEDVSKYPQLVAEESYRYAEAMVAESQRRKEKSGL